MLKKRKINKTPNKPKRKILYNQDLKMSNMNFLDMANYRRNFPPKIIKKFTI